MYLEMEMANERMKQLREDAARFRLARQARDGAKSSTWSRLFKTSRWGGSHARRGQLM